ncbi:hypothetical protein U1Q18_046023 [Sarracenia purpurea var. burkii]
MCFSTKQGLALQSRLVRRRFWLKIGGDGVGEGTLSGGDFSSVKKEVRLVVRCGRWYCDPKEAQKVLAEEWRGAGVVDLIQAKIKDFSSEIYGQIFFGKSQRCGCRRFPAKRKRRHLVFRRRKKKKKLQAKPADIWVSWVGAGDENEEQPSKVAEALVGEEDQREEAQQQVVFDPVRAA